MPKHVAVHIDDKVITINGEVVTNPIAKVVIPILAAFLGILVAGAVVFLVLPIVGVAVTLTFGVVAAFAIAVATMALLLAVEWPLLVALLALLGVVKRFSGPSI